MIKIDKTDYNPSILDDFWDVSGSWGLHRPKIGQNQWGLVLRKHKHPTAVPFLGSQKGPSARFLNGNPGRPGSRPGGIFGPALYRECEKRRFRKQQKHANMFGRLGTPGLGDPLGRPFSHYRHTAAFPGTRLGADLGVPEGPEINGKTEK